MTKSMHYALWTVQWILALLFLFAGAMKLILPAAEMTKQIALPEFFLRFIGIAEVLGAVGLILPGLLRKRQGLTPLAAAGMVIIMIGATVLMFTNVGAASATMPFMVGLLTGLIAWKRSGRVERSWREPCLLPSQS